MTPIMCFRVKGLQLYSQDYVGNRKLVADCPDEETLTWLVNSLVVFHKVSVLQWDDPR